MSRHARHDPSAPILEVAGLTVRYEGAIALDRVSFRLDRGCRAAVVGPNGAGKSTLFKAIAGVLPATEGEVRIFGSDPARHLCIAYVSQRPEVDWQFPVSVLDAVLMGRTGDLGLFRRPGEADLEFVRECLDTVGLLGLARRQIGELSGGQQQRMFIARALAQKAELMLMDEPASGLDVASQRDFDRILDELRRRGVTVLVSTHDLDLAARQFERVLLLNTRLIGFGPPADALSAGRLTQAYGGHLRVVNTPNGPEVVHDDHCGEGRP